MKKIAFFSIPAHGHTNPMLPVAAELVKNGNRVRFYSFDEFKEKIKNTGAEYVSCDSFLPKLTKQEEAGLKSVSTTEMTVQDIHITIAMNEFLDEEFQSFLPDVVYADSVCFWGKLNAWKHHLPLVVSTSTFAFNQMSSTYLKNSIKEQADMIFGLPRVSKELKKLESYGFHIKNVFQLIQSDNDTDSVVYTSRKFQPYAESFSEHYAFVGPSVFSKKLPTKTKDKPLVYISLGTVINDRLDFYKKCILALKDMNVDVIVSCGKAISSKELGTLPDHIHVYPYVNQLEVLAKSDVFITHCGMNSVSESLYMATPMVLYPQTSEQHAVARRVVEIGAGVLLKNDSPKDIRITVQKILDGKTYHIAASECSADFRACKGAHGAAEFIENAPHSSSGIDVMDKLNKAIAKHTLLYWLTAIAISSSVGVLAGRKFGVIIGIAFGIVSPLVGKAIKRKQYDSIGER